MSEQSEIVDRIMDNNLSYCDPSLKKAFHSNAKKLLKDYATFIGLKPTQYDLRSNMGGIAVSGEITLHSDKVYIQIAESSFGNSRVMYRSCESRMDYTGGQNNWLGKVSDLYLPGVLAKMRGFTGGRGGSKQ